MTEQILNKIIIILNDETKNHIAYIREHYQTECKNGGSCVMSKNLWYDIVIPADKMFDGYKLEAAIVFSCLLRNLRKYFIDEGFKVKIYDTYIIVNGRKKRLKSRDNTWN